MSAVGGNSTPATRAQVRLREVDPDFLRFVPEDERQQAGDVMLPAVDLPAGLFEPCELLSAVDGSCGVLVSGMVNRQLQLDDQVALRVLGPGNIIPGLDEPPSDVIATAEWTAVGPVRIAVIGMHFMRASARWPQLQRNLIARFMNQNEELATQLVLCQLPRVEDRLLSMLWLLAESWGKVTPVGTLLPLYVTHEALGAMIGARRPTITLALGELAERGALVQQDRGWLLLESPPQPRDGLKRVEPPKLIELAPTAWAREEQAIERVRRERHDLLELISQLREDHRRSINQLHERLRRAEAIRVQAYEIRDRVRNDRRFTDRRRSSELYG